MKLFHYDMCLILSILVLMVGCEGQEKAEIKRSEAPQPLRIPKTLEAPELNVRRPKLGESEEKLAGPNILVYKEEILVRPPFYKGSMPLVVMTGKRPLGMGQMATVCHEFNGYRNAFIYSDPALKFSGIADGVRTSNRSGRLLAEAKLVRTIKDEGIEIEEFHYRQDGRVQFYCKSRFEFGTGFKMSETEVRGKKESEYYFIWPTGGI
jgi:hypothetical protein